jgi:hypothetical protein
MNMDEGLLGQVLSLARVAARERKRLEESPSLGQKKDSKSQASFETGGM